MMAALLATPATLALMIAAGAPGVALGLLWGWWGATAWGLPARVARTLGSGLAVLPLAAGAAWIGDDVAVRIPLVALATAAMVSEPVRRAITGLLRQDFPSGAQAAGARRWDVARTLWLSRAARPLAAAACTGFANALTLDSAAGVLGGGGPPTWGSLLGAAAARGAAADAVVPALLIVGTLGLLHAVGRTLDAGQPP